MVPEVQAKYKKETNLPILRKMLWQKMDVHMNGQSMGPKSMGPKTHTVWYLEKEGRPKIETWSIDRALNNELFLWKKYAEKMHQKLVQDPFIFLVI